MGPFGQSELAGIEADRQSRAQSSRHAQTVASLQEDVQTIRELLAEVQANRKFLEAILQREFPLHPYLVDPSLRERLADAGRFALQSTNDWDAVKAAGATFSCQPFDYHAKQNAAVELAERAAHESIADYGKELIEKKRLVAELASAQAAHMATQRLAATTQAALAAQVEAGNAEIARLLERLQSFEEWNVKHFAVSRALRKELGLFSPGHALVNDSSLRERLANAAYDQYMANNRSHEAADQVADTFLSDEVLEELDKSAEAAKLITRPAG